MPRISLYRPDKGNDYKFIDARILEMFTVGGTDINVHKYISPKPTLDDDASPSTPQYNELSETSIQDLLFLENRDRKYEKDVYTLRGIYNVQDIDFNITQFGLFLNNDNIMMTVHINSSVKILGRKIISGDVLELPHLKDDYALNNLSVAVRKYYVVEEVSRAAEGYSPTWYPHLYKLKLKPIVDGQEFKDILDLPISDDEPNETLRDMLSSYNTELSINNSIVLQAEADAKLSGYETRHFFTLQKDENGNVELVTADSSLLDASTMNELADRIMQTPERDGYVGWLLGDGYAPNGEAFGYGMNFPTGSINGDYFLRTDLFPNRLFRFNGTSWKKIEDSVRMTMTNTDDRATQKFTFINNTNESEIDGEIVKERQSLSKALRPKSDNM